MKRKILSIQGVISSTFTFLLTILFVVLYACLGFAIGVFNDSIIIRKVSESNYYNEVYKDLNEQAEVLLKKSRLPSSVLQDVITLDRVYIGGKYYIEDTLSGNEPTIKMDQIKAELTGNINQYLKEEAIVRTDELDSGISEVISVIEQEYQRGIQFQFINYITSYKRDFIKLMKVVAPIVVILVGILCVFLIRMNKYKHRGIRQITYALIASSSMMILSAAYLLLTNQDKKVVASPAYYHKFLVAYLNWDIKVFLYLGLTGGIIAVLLIALIGYMKTRIDSN